MSGDLLPCPETYDIGPFRFECMGHTPIYWRDGTVAGPLAPHAHHSPRTRKEPGDVELTWYTRADDDQA